MQIRARKLPVCIETRDIFVREIHRNSPFPEFLVIASSWRSRASLFTSLTCKLALLANRCDNKSFLCEYRSRNYAYALYFPFPFDSHAARWTVRKVTAHRCQINLRRISMEMFSHHLPIRRDLNDSSILLFTVFKHPRLCIRGISDRKVNFIHENWQIKRQLFSRDENLF